MKIARYEHRGAIHYAKLLDDKTLQRIEGDVLGAWQLTDETVPLAKVSLLAPVAPPNIIAIGLNYRLHAKESNAAIPERPIIFIKATTAVIGPGAMTPDSEISTASTRNPITDLPPFLGCYPLARQWPPRESRVSRSRNHVRKSPGVPITRGNVAARGFPTKCSRSSDTR